MATTITSDTVTPKQVEPASGQGTTRPSTAPTADAPKASQAVVIQPEGAQSAYISGTPASSDAIARTLGDVQSPQNLAASEPQGAQIIIVSAGGDANALQSLVDAYATAGTEVAAQPSVTQSQPNDSATVQVNDISDNTNLKKIVSNIGDTASETTARTNTEDTTATQARAFSEATTSRSFSATEPPPPTAVSRAAVNLQHPQNPSELQVIQTVMANLESFMVDLQSLVDSYVIVNQDPVTQDIVGRQLDSKILSALMMQASGTDLGKLDPNSNVYVLDTVPQTIVEDNPGAQQYSVYDISGDMIGQFNYAEAGAWAINIGDGRVVVLGPNGYPGSTLLLDAQNRALLSGLGVPNALGPVRNRKNRGLQKISKTAGLSDPFNDPGGCASSCFLMQQALQGKKDPRQAGRCVLCHDRQQ